MAWGEKSISGATAAREDWQTGTVAKMVISDLVKDHLTTGKAVVLGGVNRDNRIQRLNTRSLQEWEVLLNNSATFSEEDDFLRTEFLYPSTITVEKGNLFGSGKKLRNAMVGESSGGSDLMPDGEYVQMLQHMSLVHVENFTQVLRAWIDDVLNKDVKRPHAGKVGYALSLLRELHTICESSVARMTEIEKMRLGDVSSNRNSAEITKAYTSMEKNVNKQSDYLRIQQENLLKERTYLAVRTFRRVAQIMSSMVKYTLESLKEWQTVLASELYSTLWRGYDGVRDQRNGLRHQEAVRKMIEESQLEAESYALYTANNGKIDDILGDLKWEVVQGIKYVESESKQYSTLQLKLSLANTELSVGNPALIARTYLDRCRNIFQRAWTNETALGWLVKIYDDSKPDNLWC